MEYFDFETDLDNLDQRSVFSNIICKLLYEKHNGDLDAAIKEGEDLFKHLDDLVRNIYEVVLHEIPLWAYSRLMNEGKDNWGYDEKEFKEKIDQTRTACEMYYKK